ITAKGRCELGRLAQALARQILRGEDGAVGNQVAAQRLGLALIAVGVVEPPILGVVPGAGGVEVEAGHGVRVILQFGLDAPYARGAGVLQAECLAAGVEYRNLKALIVIPVTGQVERDLAIGEARLEADLATLD